MKTEKTPATRVLDAICAQQWAITPEMLDTIIGIAARANARPESIQALLASRAEPLRETANATIKDGVAIVAIRGPIFRYANLFTMISGATDMGTVAQDFGEAVRNTAVKAIVLEIDSPGGMVAGVSEFAEQVRAATAIKPVVAYVSDTGASAAYWIASAASELVIRDTARVGSIGVVMQVYRDREDGEAMKFVSSQSPRKQASPDTEAGQQDYQATVDALAGVFIEAVADYRGVSTDTVLEAFGQGAVRVGADAVRAGMADRLGSLESVIAELASTTATRGTSITLPRGNATMSEKTTPAITAELIATEHPAIADHFRAQGATPVTAELVREKHPEIAAALRIEGAQAELARIQAVQAQLIPGHEALIASLIADGKTTGPEAAVQVLAAERNTREKQLGGIKNDAAVLTGVAPPAPAPAPKADRSHLPLEERCKAEWDESPELRAEYKDRFESYLSYERASTSGKVRFSSANR